MKRWISLGLGALILGCSSATGPDRWRVIGTIEHYGDPPVVSVPPAAAVGESFPVTVRTYGGGCTEKGGTRTAVEGLRARVVPYDVRIEADACTDVLRLLEHTATLRFQHAGLAVVEVRGRKEPGGEIVTVVRTIPVR